jgi:hypothetical protein
VAVRSSAWLGLIRKNRIIVAELKTFGEESWIHSAVLILNFFTMFFWDVQHGIVKKVSHALLHVWRLSIDDLHVCWHSHVLAYVQQATVDDLAVGSRVFVERVELSFFSPYTRAISAFKSKPRFSANS